MAPKTLDVSGGKTLVVPDPHVEPRATRRTYTAKYKAAILAEYDGLGRQGRVVAP